MLGELKKLAKETAVYGLSTVVGRLLNFLLLPLYTHAMAPAEYGLVATVFSYIAFLNVLYGHGMDFAYMRHEAESEDSFSTALWPLTGWAVAASILLHAFAEPVAALAGLPERMEDAVRFAAWILAFDAIALIPFAELRLRHRAFAYAGIKTFNIVVNLALNWVFLMKLQMGARGVFLAGLVASCATLVVLIPVIAQKARATFDAGSYRHLLRFALPLIPAGLASMAVQVIDRPILKALTDDASVGLYQANYRLGIFMMMVVNMFDAAWRPFFLQRSKQPGGEEILARVMTLFTAGALFVFLGITLFIPHVARWLIAPSYWAGLAVVPVVTLGYLFNGLYVNLLAPVTIAKKSERVAYATAIGAAVNVSANLILIPRLGLMGAAWATLAAYAAMAGALWLLGRGLYPIPYETGRLLTAFGLAAAVCGTAKALGLGMEADKIGLRLAVLAAFPAGLALLGFFQKLNFGDGSKSLV